MVLLNQIGYESCLFMLQDAAEEYEISAMPSFLFFKNGNKVM